MPNPGFLLAEDAALKTRLSTLSVSDDKNAERVPKVFYRWPEGETEKLYPFVTINLLDIQHAKERQHSERDYYYTTDASFSPEQVAEYTQIDYFPNEMVESDLADLAGTDGFISMEQLIPIDLLYQVTTHTRNARHDRQLTALIMRRVFPLRRGFIEIPEDGTIRRCDLLDWRSANVIDQEAGHKKRAFRKVYTVRISSELPQSDFAAVQKVLTVEGELTDNNQPTDVLSYSFSEEF